MTTRKFGYVYGGTAVFGDQVRQLDGTAWSLGRCDEARLRAVAMKDLSQSEGVPIAEIAIKEEDFWYSEIVTDSRTAGADPFRPHDASGDTVDPFSPGHGHPCTGDC